MTRWYAPAGSVTAKSQVEAVYRRDALVARADVVRQSPEALAEVNARLAESGWPGWSLSVPELAADADEAVVRLTGPSTAQADAPEVLRSVRKIGGWSPPADRLLGSLSQMRMFFVGLPAKDGFGIAGEHPGTRREAVSLIVPAPRRRPIDQVPGGRRPVVALLDSGVGPHPWLAPDAAAGSDDPFWIDAADLGWGPVDTTWAPVSRRTGDTNPVDGVLDTHAGHATFIAGLIRQLAPDARVLSMPIMRTGGVVDEDAVLDTLRWLLDRVRRAAEDHTLMVDIICTSFGYYEQVPEDVVHTEKLRDLLGELGHLGVRVVAAAGNHGETDPVWPAAFASSSYVDNQPRTRLISVGALNPDGSHAAYSNHGDWVTRWEPGTLVSTTPSFGHAPVGNGPTEYDPGNLIGGFARWTGTSFANGVLAGRLAHELMADPRWAARALVMDPDAAHERAAWAFEAVTRS